MISDEQKLAVQKMQNFIDDQILQPISLQQLAKAAGYSPYYAARLFKEIIGTTPFDYIRKLRLSGSATALSLGRRPIVDVALEFVFNSHEGFTRAFSRQFGMTPRDFRQKSPPVRLFMPDRIEKISRNRQKGGTVMNNENPLTVFVQVVERPKRRLILRRGVEAEEYFSYCEEVGCDIWSVLTAIPDALYEPAGYWLPPSLRTPGTSEYVQGVEMAADYAGLVPEGLEIIDLPPCQMMIFQGPPFADDDFAEAIEALGSVMEKYNPEPYGFVWADDDGPRFQLEPQGYRGYIEGRPVRPLLVV